MNSKKFLRSANRGVIVGLVLVVILAIYVIVDNFIFQNEKADIKALINNYATDYAATVKNSDEIIKRGNWNVDLAGKEKQKYIDLATKYFTDQTYKETSMEYLDYISLDNVNTYLDSAFDIGNLTGKGSITECRHSTDHYSISKYGPNGALVSFTLETYLTTNGVPNMIGVNLQPIYEMEEYDANGKTVSKKGSFSYTVRQNVTIQLLRESGTWKISKVGVENTNWSTSTLEVKK